MPKAQNEITGFQWFYASLNILLYPVLILAISGDWSWPEGLIWGIWFLSLCVVTTIYLYRKDPALLAERFRRPGSGKQKKWDKFVMVGMVAGFIGWIVLMPLDAKRFGWSSFPLWLQMVGGLGLLGSAFFIYRAYTDNTFLSPLVRIQKERKQKVITTGVYAFVRHPMYLGAFLMFLATPLLLGSWYGYWMGLTISLCGTVRILGEEKMLVKGLKGYPAYQKKVRYRLIPGIW